MIVILLEDQVWPRFTFLVEAASLWFKITWYFPESIVACMRTILPGPLGWETAPSKRLLVFLYSHLYFCAKLTECMESTNNFVLSDHSTRSFSWVWQTPSAFACDKKTGRASFWHSFQTVCWHGDDVLWWMLPKYNCITVILKLWSLGDFFYVSDHPLQFLGVPITFASGCFILRQGYHKPLLTPVIWQLSCMIA